MEEEPAEWGEPIRTQHFTQGETEAYHVAGGGLPHQLPG